jgi:transcriptional regulator with XRE-family HTH domain
MSELRKIVALRIRQCRKGKGWTIEETANRMFATTGEKISGSRYANWEQGLRMPAAEQVMQMAQVFGCSPAWLQGFTNNDSLSPVSSSYVSANSPNVSTRNGLQAISNTSACSAFSLEYLECRGLNKNALLSVTQIDNSMTGIVEKGDECLLDLQQNTVTGADLFGIYVGGSVWIRQLIPHVDRTVTLSAQDRDAYPDRQLSAEEVAALDIVGRVVRISHDRE